MLRIAVLVSGGGTNLQSIIDRIALKELTGVEIVCVISNSKKAFALKRAADAGIPAVCVPPSAYPDREGFHEALLARLEEYSPDLVVLAGFLVTIPPAMMRRFSGRMINIHPSLIPSFCGQGYYGLKVHEAALARGVKLSGATVHFVDEGMDSGPIILQKAVEVLEDDTPESLQRRIMEQAEWVILPKAIQLIADNRVKITGSQTIILPEEG